MFNAKYRKDLALTPETESVLLDYGGPEMCGESENLVHGLVIMLQKKWADTVDLPPSMLLTPKEDADRSLNAIMADMERDLLRRPSKYMVPRLKWPYTSMWTDRRYSGS